MKRVYQWFEYLPEEIRDKAQAYYFESYEPDEYDFMAGSLESALTGGFPWYHTEEGILYWEKITDKYKNQQP